jgi:hypothetical protein
MYAVIVATNSPMGVRETVVVPVTTLDGTSTIRTFTRVGLGLRGTAGAWQETTPLQLTEPIIGEPFAKAVTPSDYGQMQLTGHPTTLLQKLSRTTDPTLPLNGQVLGDVLSDIQRDALNNPMLNIKYTKQMSKPMPITVVHSPVATPVAAVATPTPVTPQVVEPHTQTLEEEPMITTTIPSPTSANAALVVPDLKHYVERTIDGKRETEVYDYARSNQQNVLLTGDAGTGKTSSARNYAATHNLPFVTIECTQQIDQSITQGRFVPTGVGNSTQWKYSQLATAIQQPSVVLINELTRMSPKAASLFLRLLEERELLIEPLNEVIKVHPDCIFIADQNTGIGYTGTSRQDNALLDRFNIKVEFKYDIDIEKKFIDSPTLLQFAHSIREASELNDQFSIPMSSRLLRNFQDQARGLGMRFAINTMLNSFPKSDGEREGIKMRLDADLDSIAGELGVVVDGYSTK